jgi:predicted secreted protein
MATPTTLRGTQLYIKIGDGASPETFTHPCTINAERGIVFRSTTNDIIVPDCTNPDDPAWRELVKDALSAGITGSGILDATLSVIQSWDTWFRGDDGKNVQVWLGNIGYWQGSFKLTEWNPQGDRNNKITTPITLESDGVVDPFTAGP